jgi:hypothetical protein
MKLASMASYVGVVKPKFLILTGRREWGSNSPRYNAALTPALNAPRYHAIMERLMPYHEIGILSQDSDQIKDAWPMLGEPYVIAADLEAYSACAIAGIQATPVKHAITIMDMGRLTRV